MTMDDDWHWKDHFVLYHNTDIDVLYAECSNYLWLDKQVSESSWTSGVRSVYNEFISSTVNTYLQCFWWRKSLLTRYSTLIRKTQLLLWRQLHVNIKRLVVFDGQNCRFLWCCFWILYSKMVRHHWGKHSPRVNLLLSQSESIVDLHHQIYRGFDELGVEWPGVEGEIEYSFLLGLQTNRKFVLGVCFVYLLCVRYHLVDA